MKKKASHFKRRTSQKIKILTTISLLRYLAYDDLQLIFIEHFILLACADFPLLNYFLQRFFTFIIYRSYCRIYDKNNLFVTLIH